MPAWKGGRGGRRLMATIRSDRQGRFGLPWRVPGLMLLVPRHTVLDPGGYRLDRILAHPAPEVLLDKGVRIEVRLEKLPWPPSQVTVTLHEAPPLRGIPPRKGQCLKGAFCFADVPGAKWELHAVLGGTTGGRWHLPLSHRRLHVPPARERMSFVTAYTGPPLARVEGRVETPGFTGPALLVLQGETGRWRLRIDRDGSLQPGMLPQGTYRALWSIPVGLVSLSRKVVVPREGVELKERIPVVRVDLTCRTAGGFAPRRLDCLLQVQGLYGRPWSSRPLYCRDGRIRFLGTPGRKYRLSLSGPVGGRKVVEICPTGRPQEMHEVRLPWR